MKTEIKAEIVADSLSPQEDRLISILCVTDVNTLKTILLEHKDLSVIYTDINKVEFIDLIKQVEENPFIPIAWQKDHKGMQGSDYITDTLEIQTNINAWNIAKNNAIRDAKRLYNNGVTKQLCNRLLEPFMWTTMLITGSKEGWDNFFELKCPQYLYDYEDKPIYFKSKKDWVNYYNESQGYKKDNPEFTKIKDLSDLEWLQINKGQAEIHMMALAEEIYDAMNESTPKQLNPGEWHIPFSNNINDDEILQKIAKKEEASHLETAYDIYQYYAIKIATAHCARLSYMIFDKEIDYEKDIQLHDILLTDKYILPFEHCARAMSDDEYISFIKGEVETGWIDESEHQIFLSRDDHDFGKYEELGWCRNFKGFIQYRHIVES